MLANACHFLGDPQKTRNECKGKFILQEAMYESLPPIYHTVYQVFVPLEIYKEMFP